MYDAVLFVLGDQRWRHLQLFFDEAVRWTDGRKPVLVHGDFSEQNIVVDGGMTLHGSGVDGLLDRIAEVAVGGEFRSGV